MKKNKILIALNTIFLGITIILLFVGMALLRADVDAQQKYFGVYFLSMIGLVCIGIVTFIWSEFLRRKAHKFFISNLKKLDICRCLISYPVDCEVQEINGDDVIVKVRLTKNNIFEK